MRRGYWLVLLWLLIAALIAGLTLINPTRYTSVDSLYYLSKAGRLVGLDGDQYGHRAVGWEGDFPVGYPLLMGGVARLTGLSLLVASKVVNGLFIGLFFLLWYRRVGTVATLWMGSVWLLGGNLRLIAYTWSECAFLVLLLEWLWQVRSMAGPGAEPTRYGPSVRLLLLSMALFTLRYAGGFFVVAYGLWVLTTYLRGGRAVVDKRLGPDLLYGLGAVGFMGGTFLLNSLLSPWPLGTERFYDTPDTVGDKLAVLALAPLNEALLLRDYVIGEPNALVGLGLVLQIGLLVWLWRLLRPRRETITPPGLAEKQLFVAWCWASGTYLIGLYVMRWFSPFAGPNARMMSLVTMPLLMGVALWVSRWPNLTLRRQVGRWWVVVLLCSWLQLLPQADLWGKLMRYVPALTVSKLVSTWPKPLTRMLIVPPVVSSLAPPTDRLIYSGLYTR